MLAPLGIINLENRIMAGNYRESNFVLKYKRIDGCINTTKYFKNPLKLLKCIRQLQKSRKYSIRIFEEVY